MSLCISDTAVVSKAGNGGLQLSFKLLGEGGLLLILKFKTTTKKRVWQSSGIDGPPALKKKTYIVLDVTVRTPEI